MKNIIILLLCVLSLGLAHAQERNRQQQRTPEEMAKLQVERLTKELNLSQVQQDSIHKHILAISSEQQKIFRESGTDRETAMRSMQPLRDKQAEKIKSFLNAEQLKKYEAMPQRGNRPAGQRPN